MVWFLELLRKEEYKTNPEWEDIGLVESEEGAAVRVAGSAAGDPGLQIPQPAQSLLTVTYCIHIRLTWSLSHRQL